MDTPLVDDVVLGGRYRLLALLGSGGMAQVYDGWDERLSRPVAVKLLRPDLAAVADLRRRFELEARAAARLTHPNVVSVFDAGDDNGRSYIVMERLRGESLADSIGHGPVDVDWLRRLAGEVLAALGAAHGAGIVHRDIKPANILLGPDGRAKVADFGIARVVEASTTPDGANAETASALTGAGLVVGTPAYLAPERVMGIPATPQSDLYSLGVVLYEALTGTKPYAGTTPVAIAAAAVQGAAPNPALLRPGADPQLVAVIGRAMALDPAQRYATAAEMAADLRRPVPPPTSVMTALPVPVPMGVSGGGRLGLTEAGLTAVPGAASLLPPVPTPPLPPVGPPLRLSAPTSIAETPASWEQRQLLPPPRGHRWGLAAVGIGAAVVIALAAVARPGAGNRASSTPTTGAPAATAPTVPTARSTTPQSPTAPTAPTAVVAGQSDPVAAALQSIITRLGRSTSVAAGSLAAGLTSVASITDPARRADAASRLLDQTVVWYQQGQLTSTEYALAAAVLHIAGAPTASPPTVIPSKGNSGGGGGGGD